MFKEANIKPFESKVWLSSPTMHGDELKYIQEAYETNWMSTVGQIINEAEKMICDKVGCKYAVALPAGTASLTYGGEACRNKPLWYVRNRTWSFRGQKGVLF